MANETTENRQQFSSKLGFLLSAIGSAIGLGNIWRYPYVAYANGGGAFLVPYFVALLTAGIPLLVLEYILGTKYRGATPLAFARISKKFEFVGWIPTIVAGLIVFYYSSILSWAMNFLVLSFTKGWGSDPNAFFFNDFLKLSDNPLSLGSFNLKIFIGLVIVWGGTYLICSKNIDQGLEKANKVLIPLMVIAIAAVVIRGITLPGAVDGMNALFNPDWKAVASPKVWVAAYGQVFFSLSVAMGIMVTYSSYLPKGSELVNTSFVAGLANSTFEFTVAIGVFGILGYMASQQGVPVTEVVTAGVGLAFVVFPEGINLMGGAGTVVGIMFFLCLVAAGLTSFVSLLEAFSAPFVEKFNMPRKKVFGITCLVGFLASVIYATGAGLYVLDMVDYTCNNYGLTIVGILQAVVCGWILNKLPEFKAYANRISYFKVGGWWDVCIKFVIPLVVFFNLLFAFIDFLKQGYEGYSPAALGVWCGGTAAVIVIFVVIMTKAKWRMDIDDYEEQK